MAGRALMAWVLLSMAAIVIAVAAHRWEVTAYIDNQQHKINPDYMLELTERSLHIAAAPALAEVLADAVYTVYFRWSGIHAAITGRSEAVGFIRRALHDHPDDIAVAMLAGRLFGIRTANALLLLPFILIIVIVAMIDGFTERAIRRASGGHESGTTFRLARRFAFSLLPPVIGLVYLGLPIDMTPTGVLLPVMVVVAVLVRTKCKYYKKYI
jgi:hypothetical protein